ncbi:SAM-dependent methyltransferase [Oceanicoccus sp. KOV_DT_Chl]|uniref:class I SAM-dependent methyltransferase n=1 Tax=Oceanicoccus sp. KOV_DT_Chl TaxID=1904639 RepID=UPI000C79A713|nr:SAM-dependent methyltransferase [Oceanicoccus sp. KOV_DT_Chl]
MSTLSSDETLTTFINILKDAISRQRLERLLLSKYRGDEKDLQRITIRLINLRQQLTLSFVYSYKTRDITKNYSPDEALSLVSELMSSDFKSAHLSTASETIQLEISKKGKVSLHTHKASVSSDHQGTKSADHNRHKKRFVDINRPFLTALGVTDKQQQLIPSMSKKWKQINKFIEVFSQALENSGLNTEQALNVVDFGSGKGYLTFAIHDYLANELQNSAAVTGVELRANLAELCNNIANTLDHGGLQFVCGDVQTHAPQHTDVMIALHACDTATDYAIHYGIRAQASIIMCSPCCHKQIRPQMASPSLLQPMLKYGVHLGQQAEMVTDSLRALLLEANGYTTKVFEFISLEHTNKNKMILAVKNKQSTDTEAVLQQIAEIKTFYGIEQHCLETLLESSAE